MSSAGNSSSSHQLSAEMQETTQAWQQLIQTLESPPSAQQQEQVLAILRANPELMPSFVKLQQQLQQGAAWQQQQQAAAWQQQQQQAAAWQQQQQASWQQQQQAARQQQQVAWQQLLQTLEYPASAQQQQQVLAILRGNPELTDAFIQVKTSQQQ